MTLFGGASASECLIPDVIPHNQQFNPVICDNPVLPLEQTFSSDGVSEFVQSTGSYGTIFRSLEAFRESLQNGKLKHAPEGVHHYYQFLAEREAHCGIPFDFIRFRATTNTPEESPTLEADGNRFHQHGPGEVFMVSLIDDPRCLQGSPECTTTMPLGMPNATSQDAYRAQSNPFSHSRTVSVEPNHVVLCNTASPHLSPIAPEPIPRIFMFAGHGRKRKQEHITGNPKMGCRSFQERLEDTQQTQRGQEF